MQENLNTGTAGRGNASVGQKAGFAKEVWAKQLAAQKKVWSIQLVAPKIPSVSITASYFFAAPAGCLRFLLRR